MGDDLRGLTDAELERKGWQGYTDPELVWLRAAIETTMADGFLSKRETRSAKDRAAAITRELDRRMGC